MIDHRGHFDEQSADWDRDPSKVERATVIADAIRGAVSLRGDERVYEFGAGTGLVSQMLAPHVGPLTLGDNSTGMRDIMARKVASGELPDGTIISDIDLIAGRLPAGKFDLAVASLVLHHIEDIPQILGALHKLLEEGGHVAIADLDEEDGSFHQHMHDFDGHNGFDRDTLRRDLEAAGFRDVEFRDVTTLEKEAGNFAVFLATGRR